MPGHTINQSFLSLSLRNEHTDDISDVGKNTSKYWESSKIASH